MVNKRPLLIVGLFIASLVVAVPGAATTAAPPGSWLPPTPQNWNVVVDQSATAPVTVTRGVTERSETYDTVGGRQHTQVMDVDLADPNVRLGVVEAGNTVTDPADETVSSMAARTGAVAGVNGDYFEIHASGRPLGGVISDGTVLKSPRPNYNAQLGIRPDGSMVMGPETFSGTVTDGAASYALASVNVVNDVAAGGITEITADMGALSGLGASTLVVGHKSGAALVVDGVQTGVTMVPALTTNQEDLLGGGAGGSWLAATVHAGDTIGLAQKISPDNDLRQLVSGATMLVKDGQVYTDPTGTPPGGVNPETAVGLTKDGRHAIIVTLDGRAGESTAVGVSPAQAAGYLVAHGAYTGILFDGGGSTEMVARTPGATADSVTNTPSDGVERPVANGIFVYTTEARPGPATAVTINQAKPVTTVTGASVPVPVYATDALANPARDVPSVQVLPSSLGGWSNGTLTVKRSGVGVIIARAGHAVSVQPLRVVDGLSTLTVSPSAPDLNNGASQTFALSGTTLDGSTVDIPAAAASWSVSPASLGTVDTQGKFTAAASGGGMATVTAKVAGTTASAVVAVGSTSIVLDDLSDVPNWNLRNTTGQPASMSLDTTALPPGSTAPGSLKLSYTMPAGAGVKQLVMWPKTDLQVTTDPQGQNPTGIGLWVKGNGTGIELAESYASVDGTTTTLYPTTVTWQGWQLVIAQLPAGLNFPLDVNFLDFLAINPSTTTTGSLNIAGLQALYSPRPVVVPPYTAIPGNPAWLSYAESTSRFGPGQTLLVGDDAHLLAGDPGSTSANVLATVKNRVAGLPAAITPGNAQYLGDMADDGALADLNFAKSEMTSVGVPYRDAVGNHEISQGALPENGDFTQVFGNTHYSYTVGAANVIVTDNAHGSLLSSDAYQVPAEAQYPWLVAQLTANTSRAVIVTTHMPAYDPHPSADSQFSDRWEARMYVRLVQRYQQTHPDKHVIMLYGHARGFAEQILQPDGTPGSDERCQPSDADASEKDSNSAGRCSIPQITVADLGMPPYATAAQGGFYNFGLFRIGPDGDIRFTVEPVLASIAITVPDGQPTPGTRETLSATGTEVSGDNLPVATMPIADPASHVWTSSDPRIASIDPVSGVLTAHRPGSVTVSIESGGVTATTSVVVGS